MDLRTTFNIPPSENKISYDGNVMFIGSCFASSIGLKMLMGRMPVMINPAGTVYNPVSVGNTIDTIITEDEFTINDLYCYDGKYLSFYHYTDFSSDDAGKVLEKINIRSKEALSFLKKAQFLFITFGTARIYRFKTTGLIVSNCHKIPPDHFESEILSVKQIVDLWENLLDRLKSLFPLLKIVFTISPVRHWKDGAHGNQISKSVLFLAVEELMKHPFSPQYFPAYELLMDDLRDYRFYGEDMLHPSPLAIDYIWNAFSNCYLDSEAVNIRREVMKITKALDHKLGSGSVSKINDFARQMLGQISRVEKKVPSIDLSAERSYFMNLLKT